MGVLDKYRGEQKAVPLLRAEDVAGGARTWVIQGPPYTLTLDGGPKDAVPLRNIASGDRRDMVLKRSNGARLVEAMTALGRTEETLSGLVVTLTTADVPMRGKSVRSIEIVSVTV